MKSNTEIRKTPMNQRMLPPSNDGYQYYPTRRMIGNDDCVWKAIRQESQGGGTQPEPALAASLLQLLEEMGVEKRRRGFYAHWVRQFFDRNKGSRRSEGTFHKHVFYPLSE